MVTLETLFNPAQKVRLAQAIPRRYACRTFSAEPSTADWAALSYAAQRYALPGARLILCHVSESLFTGTLLNMGRVTGCTTIAAVVASSAHPQSRIHAGVLGEAFVLDAVSMGLGTCWISGTYRKKQLSLPLAADEAVLAIIALGKPSEADYKPTPRRKSLERLCADDLAAWPEGIRNTAEAVRLAPSAMNMQPIRMAWYGNTYFALDASDRSRLDLGIGLCHAELTLPRPHRWLYAKTRKDPAVQAQCT